MKFVKKPVVIEAVPIPIIDEPVPDWFADAIQNKQIIIARKKNKKGITIKTLEGDMFAPYGESYVVCGIEGELYPVKKEIFEKTYEAYEE